MIEQDHGFIKKRIQNMLGLKLLRAATKMMAGIDVMRMFKKGQLKLRGSLSKIRIDVFIIFLITYLKVDFVRKLCP